MSGVNYTSHMTFYLTDNGTAVHAAFYSYPDRLLESLSGCFGVPVIKQGLA